MSCPDCQLEMSITEFALLVVEKYRENARRLGSRSSEFPKQLVRCQDCGAGWSVFIDHGDFCASKLELKQEKAVLEDYSGT